MRQTVAILSFSPIARDARVLRQIEHLAPRYDLLVVGYGPPPPRWDGVPGVAWLAVPEAPPMHRRTPVRLARSRLLLLLSRLHPAIFDAWYWGEPARRSALALALARSAPGLAVVHANDWQTLPLALRLARLRGAKLVLDLHEYAPLEFEDDLEWRLTYGPAIRSLLMRLAPHVSASITVGHVIAERYRAEFPLDPIVVLNAPSRTEAPERERASGQVRMIHHGGAIRSRRLEQMVDVLSHCDERFTLDFMLVGDEAYIADLRAYAAARAPGRVSFLAPVRPDEVVARLSAYDLGFYLLRPTNYNNSAALPNKLFDFLAAGLAVCVGPSPEMARLVHEHGCGVVAPSFEPADVAAVLSRLDGESLAAMRRAARRASETLNAANEMAKLTALYERLTAADPLKAERS
jgi:glycosyltransferase involved in cell wall biosynthesis